ncbi:uncharacterized protein EV420DRAFT_1515664 [Desarmillaria tabescens]|uniref:Uncharacterized protein n=1 Tax=Armillaria tabescens TaxID=1929756 RepID=A0AA39TV15_ARMTA|nr:uncharacterized protein EV420DRAFT_1515664 [Desarmillaria tabescens]KAK0464279.1 hypothetical protein EV420DRAFT_1515664 [Desarmillaria tabescens]
MDPHWCFSDMGPVPPVLLGIWIYFNLISNTILLPLLVLTFLFSTRAGRHPTLINLCMTWIFSGIFSLLLFYAGKHEPDSPEPPKPLCIAQTSLLYGITPMWSVAILVFVYHMTVTTIGGYDYPTVGKGRMVVMLSVPYLVQCSFSIAALVISLSHPDLVSRHHRKLYCTLVYLPLYNAMSLFTSIVCVAIVSLEIYLAIFIYRNYRGMRQARHSTGLYVALLLRVLVFGLYILFGIVIDFVAMFNDHTFIGEMYLATMGTVVFLVFGTQADVLRVWCFWRRDDLRKKPVPKCPSQSPTWSIDFSKTSSPDNKGEPLHVVTTGLESGGAGHGDRYFPLGN